jgi:hypothetical protein
MFQTFGRKGLFFQKTKAGVDPQGSRATGRALVKCFFCNEGVSTWTTSSGHTEERWDYEQIIQRTRAAGETDGKSDDQAAEVGDGRAESLFL